MSRSFDLLDDTITVDPEVAVVTAAPFTIAHWGRATEVSALKVSVFIGDKDATNEYWAVRWRPDTGSQQIQFSARTAVGDTNASTTTGYTVNKWHFVACVARSSIDRSVYIDNGSEGTNITDRAPAGADRTQLGQFGDSTPTNPFGGELAYVHIYNRALSLNELNQIMWYPGSITNGLVLFLPLFGTSVSEPNYSSGKNNCTVSGAIKGTTEPPISGIFTIPQPQLTGIF